MKKKIKLSDWIAKNVMKWERHEEKPYTPVHDEWIIGIESENIEVTANTFEVAICKFAKKLFSRQKGAR